MCIQISNGMSAPFPLNIVLLPVTMTESYLQVCICFSVSVSDSGSDLLASAFVVLC